MGKKDKRKVAKSHSTAISAVTELAEQLVKLDTVTKISLGIIKQCKALRGNRRVKINTESGAYLLKVRDICSIQDLRVYSSAEDFEKTLREQIVKVGFDVQ